MRKVAPTRQKSKFTLAVVRIVQAIPAGKVISYGQVAAYVGVPRAARQAGWILRQTKEDVPWWRVINNQGKISIKGNWQHEANEQRELLRKEGVVVNDNFEIEMVKYRFTATRVQMEKWGLPEEYLEMVWIKFGRGY